LDWDECGAEGDMAITMCIPGAFLSPNASVHFFPAATGGLQEERQIFKDKLKTAPRRCDHVVSVTLGRFATAIETKETESNESKN